MTLKKSVALAAILLLGTIAFYFISTSRRDPLQSYATKLDGLISADRIRRQVAVLAAKPHPAGSQENQEAGDAIIARLKELHLQVSTAEYPVTIYQPLQQQLILTSPVSRDFDLKEKVLSSDPYSKIAGSQIPYFAYSPDADVQAEVIYANYGTREDYAQLKKNGVAVTGKIALVRAQGICRSMKAQIAEEEGIAGLLLYPELRDQGMTKTPFPDGPGLNPWTAQRGSLLKYYLNPGDVEGSLPTVPALPISAQTALELFGNIAGTPAPAEWTGGMAVAYHMGPGPARVHLIIKGTLVTRTIRDIFGILPGTNKVEPRLLVSGHYDAWVYGACDPCSGTATILETAAALAALAEKGWKPRRSIQFAFWDAEEFGLLGSARWTQQNVEDLRNHVSAHFYVDSIRATNFTAYITPVLRAELDHALLYVNDPEQQRKFSEIRGEFALPGFSDDTAPMTGFAATPSARLGFGTYYSVYHSLYDDLKWMNEYCDPGFRYSAALVKILSLFAIQMSDQPILPFHFSEISTSVTDKLSNENLHEPKLERAIQSFDRSAKKLQEVLQKHANVTDLNATRVNRIFLETMQSFLTTDESFSRKNLLIAPAVEEGCNGELVPSAAQRSSDLASAFSKASNRLQQATKLLEE